MKRYFFQDLFLCRCLKSSSKGRSTIVTELYFCCINLFYFSYSFFLHCNLFPFRQLVYVPVNPCWRWGMVMKALKFGGIFIIEGFVHLYTGIYLLLPGFNERHRVSKVAQSFSDAQVCTRAEAICVMWLSRQPKQPHRAFCATYQENIPKWSHASSWA